MASQYKRLDFYELKGDLNNRNERMRKGLLLELDTPKFSIPYSVEGSDLWNYIDRQNIFAIVGSRNELIKLVNNKYPDFRVLDFLVSSINETDGNTINARLEYLPTGEIIEAKNNIGV